MIVEICPIADIIFWLRISMTYAMIYAEIPLNPP